MACLDGNQKIVVELHPAQLGERGVRAVLERIETAGFEPISWLSSNRKRYFERRPVAIPRGSPRHDDEGFTGG